LDSPIGRINCNGSHICGLSLALKTVNWEGESTQTRTEEIEIVGRGIGGRKLENELLKLPRRQKKKGPMVSPRPESNVSGL
jgi:hypothetical protein